MDAFRAQLESQAPPKPQDADVDVVDMTGQPLTGEELRGLVVARWGRPYDTRITQRRNKLNQLKLYLQVPIDVPDMPTTGRRPSTASFGGALAVVERARRVRWMDHGR
jgi:hypothetical protein